MGGNPRKARMFPECCSEAELLIISAKDYSHRSAMIGSTRRARRAGI